LGYRFGILFDVGSAQSSDPTHSGQGTDNMPHPVFTFDTTHHALWAEELATEDRIPVEIIPAPAQAGARCDLALETLREEVDRLEALLTRNGVEFRLFDGLRD
jgi:hypothetical protein